MKSYKLQYQKGVVLVRVPAVIEGVVLVQIHTQRTTTRTNSTDCSTINCCEVGHVHLPFPISGAGAGVSGGSLSADTQSHNSTNSRSISSASSSNAAVNVCVGTCARTGLGQPRHADVAGTKSSTMIDCNTKFTPSLIRMRINMHPCQYQY